MALMASPNLALVVTRPAWLGHSNPAWKLLPGSAYPAFILYIER